MSMHDPSPRAQVFRTSRLTCRPVEPDDAGDYAALFANPALLAHRPDPTPLSRVAADKMLADEVAHWQRHGFGRWALCHAGHVVGFGGLTVKPGFEGLNLSYHLHPDVWGQGLASEFVQAVLDHAQATHAAKVISGLVRPSNAPSIRVLEKAGFTPVGEIEMGGAPMRHFQLEIG